MSEKPVDKELALRNVIANQAHAGHIMTKSEIERGRKTIYGELSIDDAIAEIHLELHEDMMAEANNSLKQLDINGVWPLFEQLEPSSKIFYYS